MFAPGSFLLPLLAKGGGFSLTMNKLEISQSKKLTAKFHDGRLKSALFANHHTRSQRFDNNSQLRYFGDFGR